MNDRPVIDLLFEAFLNDDTQRFDTVYATRAGECADLRMLLSTTAEGGVDLDLGLGLAPCEFVTPIFEGPRALMVSRHTAVQSRLANGRSNVLLDYSIGFDSNFAERVRGMVNGENVSQVDRDRVTTVLMLKATNPRVQFDVQPFLIENTRFDRDQENNLRPLNTLVAFYMLDHLDWQAFEADPTRFKFDAPVKDLRSSLVPAAEEFLTSLHASPQILKREAMALGTQALLLRFATLWNAKSKPDVRRVLSDLVDFSILELGCLPLAELTLIWSGINTKQVAPFFGPIINQSNELRKKISGMAWDMTHLRALHDAAKQTTLGSFFIPYFASLDTRWRELLRLNPIRIMLVDDSKHSANFGRTRDVEFQRTLGEIMSKRAVAEMTEAKIHARRLTARDLDREAMSQLAEREFHAWEDSRRTRAP